MMNSGMIWNQPEEEEKCLGGKLASPNCNVTLNGITYQGIQHINPWDYDTTWWQDQCQGQCQGLPSARATASSAWVGERDIHGAVWDSWKHQIQEMGCRIMTHLDERTSQLHTPCCLIKSQSCKGKAHSVWFARLLSPQRALFIHSGHINDPTAERIS